MDSIGGDLSLQDLSFAKIDAGFVQDMVLLIQTIMYSV